MEERIVPSIRRISPNFFRWRIGSTPSFLNIEVRCASNTLLRGHFVSPYVRVCVKFTVIADLYSLWDGMHISTLAVQLQGFAHSADDIKSE